MLRSASDDTNRRYLRLRQYFADLHCTTALMEEQFIPKRRAKNLICVLPGRDAERIVVAARYDRRSGVDDPAQGWTEAAMLPILYNALLAGRRQHTFVFAELCGTAGENAFLTGLHGKQRPSPKAMVVTGTMGLSSPWYYTSEEIPLSAKGRARAAVNRRLEAEAAFTARLQGLPVSLTATQAAVQNSLLFEADPIPAILVYSTFKWKGPAVSEAFRQDFEFLAYYLCRIDLKLANSASSNPSGIR
jgi:hypothetical protein